MTKELAKQWVVILQAYADGKIIQVQHYDDKGETTWFDVSEPLLNGWGDPGRYRIKRKPREFWITALGQAYLSRELALNKCGGEPVHVCEVIEETPEVAKEAYK